MNQFVQQILVELKTNPGLNSDPLIKILVDSADKSIALGENSELVYSNLKKGIAAINEKINSPALDIILLNFTKNEDTVDSKVMKIAKSVNLEAKIQSIKEADSYVVPIFKSTVDLFEQELASGAPDFLICGKFVDFLEQHRYDEAVAAVSDQIKKHISENYDKFLVLGAISQMYAANSPVYAGIISDLKTMLVNESYTADILKLKYGKSVPLITDLVSALRVVESKKSGEFTIGEGDQYTKISNLIAPSVKTNDGMIIYVDNRFLSIRESNGLTGNETKVHHDGTMKISDFTPAWVKENFPGFYDLCEAYAMLGFSKSFDGMGIESNSIKNTKIGLKINETKGLDLMINGEKVGDPKTVNVSEALCLESNQTKARLSTILNNSAHIYNFEFIKEVTNDRTLSEAIVVSIDTNYYVCEKINVADREWTKMDEFAMCEFFKHKFSYDVSSIFKTQIDEATQVILQAEEAKRKIESDLTKLDESLIKLNASISNPNLNQTESNKLVSVRESIESLIHQLKQDYIQIDLYKKKELK